MSFMDDVNNGGLLGSVFIQTNEKTYHAVKDVLDLMGLPDAPYSAHLHMPNSNRVYLSEEGLVVTLVHNHPGMFNLAASKLGFAEPKPSPVFLAAQVRTDLILQPLFAADLTGQCRLEIVPGIPQAAVTAEDMKHHADLLHAEGIRLISPHPEVMGEIRAPDGGRHLVVGNRRRVGMDDKSLLPGAGDPVQEEIYGGLRAAFSRAFENKDPEKVQAVLAYCAQINALPASHPDKILHTPWTEADRQGTERQQAVSASAAHYAHLRHRP